MTFPKKYGAAATPPEDTSRLRIPSRISGYS